MKFQIIPILVFIAIFSISFVSATGFGYDTTGGGGGVATVYLNSTTSNVNDSNFLNGHNSSYFYPYSNPLAFISAEVDPIFAAWLAGFNYNYNQTQPAEAYTDAQIAANNNSWSSTYNATYQLWAYNQTCTTCGATYNATYDAGLFGINGTYNSTYNTWAYNQSSGYVPYNGANDTVNLNMKNFTAGNIMVNGTAGWGTDPDDVLGYPNTRLGTDGHFGGRISFEFYNSGTGADTLWQIDNGGDSLRFYNASSVFATINQTGLFENKSRVCTTSNGVCDAYNSTYNATYAAYAYNMTYTGGSYNATYQTWAYNMSDGSYNSTYALWAYNQTGIYNYNQSDGSYNATYDAAIAGINTTYNATYQLWAYNQTGIYNYNQSDGSYNATYDSAIAIMNSTYNATYQTWAYNQTGIYNYNQSDGSYNATYDSAIAGINTTYNATYNTWAYNQTGIYNYNQSDGSYNATYDSAIAIMNSTYNSTYDTWAYNQSQSSITSSATAGFIPQMQNSSMLNNSLLQQLADNIGFAMIPGGVVGGYPNFDINGTLRINSGLIYPGTGNVLKIGGGSGELGTSGIRNSGNLLKIIMQTWGIQVNGTLTADNISVNGNVTADYFFGKVATFNSTYDLWAYNQTGIYNYNQSDGSYNATYDAAIAIMNNTYNATYQTWAYNQSDGSYNSTYDSAIAIMNNTYNATYQTWAYNQTNTAFYNASYDATYNSTYNQWAYNMTVSSPFDYNHTLAIINLYGQWFYNMSDGSYNSTYDIWAYNQTCTTCGATYNATYDTWAYNMSNFTSSNDNWTLHNNYPVDCGDGEFEAVVGIGDVLNCAELPDSAYTTYNSTYALWAYNQSDGSYNATYNTWAYNMTITAFYNSTYDSTYNATYNTYAYNMSDGSYNSTYALWAYNMTATSIYNATYALWSYNQSDGSYNSSYATWLTNETAYGKYWYNMTNTAFYNDTYNLWSYNQTTTAIYNDSYVQKAGDTMSGNLSLNGQSLNNVTMITYQNSSGSAVWKTYYNGTALVTELI